MAVTVAAGGMQTGVVTRDVERMLGFYRDHLGFEVREVADVGGPTRTRIHLLTVTATATLKLVELDPTPGAVNPGDGMFGASGLRYLTIWVESIDPALDGIEATGARVVGVFDTDGRFGSKRLAIVEDPDGNVLEIVEPS